MTVKEYYELIKDTEEAKTEPEVYLIKKFIKKIIEEALKETNNVL